MSDKPLYQAHEADKWFDRYVATIKERDEARAAFESCNRARQAAEAEVRALRARLAEAETNAKAWEMTARTNGEACTGLEERLRLAEAVVEAADRFTTCICEFGETAPSACSEWLDAICTNIDAYRAATSPREEDCIRDRHGEVIVTKEDLDAD